MTEVEHPGKRLRELLIARNWTQDELAKITGKSRQAISNIVSCRGSVTPEMAIALGAAFGIAASEWMSWAAEYDLSRADVDHNVQRRAKLYGAAPIKELSKRGWIEINEGDTDDDLERKLNTFYGGELNSTFQVAARRSARFGDLSQAEIAWFYRARQLAASILVKEFSQSRLVSAESALRKAAAYPKDAAKVAKILSEHGIRFVVIEPLPGGTKVDGAAFWLNAKSPVIALSVRFDRVDAFWFTLFHEFFHIKHGDAMSIDVDVLRSEQDGAGVSVASEAAEQKANDASANALVPKEEIDSFVRRVAPYYSSERIVQFAHRVKIHPGIIVGQLQNRGEIGFHALRNFLVKIREPVITTALTDGWGQLGPRLG